MGDNRLYEPGRNIPVDVAANTAGEVAGRGQMVELVGQTSDNAQVALSAGGGVGHLARVADDYDENATYADGDSAGLSKVYLTGPVDKFETADSATLAPGDLVVDAGDGGVRAYDPVDTGANDTADMVLGRVWRTNVSGNGDADKVAVYRHR